MSMDDGYVANERVTIGRSRMPARIVSIEGGRAFVVVDPGFGYEVTHVPLSSLRVDRRRRQL